MSIKVKEGVNASGAVKVTAKKHRWYLGGFASATAACVTHPLDLLKVLSSKQFHLQGVEMRSLLTHCIELALVWLQKGFYKF